MIPFNFERLELHHCQANRKSNISAVLEKDESFKLGTFHQDLSYHSNEITPCPFYIRPNNLPPEIISEIRRRDHVSIYLKLRYYVKYELILLRAKNNQNSSSGFYFQPNLRIIGAIFDKMQNNGLHQLIFTPMFRKVKRSNFSEIFTRGNYMLRPECHLVKSCGHSLQ